MKKILFDRYGSSEVLSLRDVEVPTLGASDVLVRVQAAALNPADWHFMVGLPYFIRVVSGVRRPEVTGIGSDLAGVVEEVGPAVTRVRPGDPVFGRVDQRDSRVMELGSVAEYVRVSEASIRPRPSSLSAEEAAGIALAGTTALAALRDVADVQPGQRVLVNGASGGVGTFAVQLARARGAEVVGVCSSRNVGLVRSLGADHVVDYTREDVTENGARFDVVLDNVGNHTAAAWRRVVAPGGIYIASFDHPHRRWLGPLRAAAGTAARWAFAPQRVAVLQPKRRDDDLDDLAALIDAGELRPVVDRTFPLADTAAAMDHLASRRARGKVVITVEEVPA